MHTLSKSRFNQFKFDAKTLHTHPSNDEQILTLLKLFGFWNLIGFYDTVFAS